MGGRKGEGGGGGEGWWRGGEPAPKRLKSDARLHERSEPAPRQPKQIRDKRLTRFHYWLCCVRKRAYSSGEKQNKPAHDSSETAQPQQN